MEGEEYGEGNDGHIHREAQVREKGSFIGAVIATVGVHIVEEERTEERRSAKN